MLYELKCGGYEITFDRRGWNKDGMYPVHRYDLAGCTNLASDKAQLNDCETIKTFTNEKEALKELSNYKCDIYDSQFVNGQGYSGTCYWIDDGKCLTYADWEILTHNFDEEDE